jgi:hypothetical protein
VRTDIAAKGVRLLTAASTRHRELQAVERIVGDATPPDIMIFTWSQPWHLPAPRGGSVTPSAMPMENDKALQH